MKSFQAGGFFYATAKKKRVMKNKILPALLVAIPVVIVFIIGDTSRLAVEYANPEMIEQSRPKLSSGELGEVSAFMTLKLFVMNLIIPVGLAFAFVSTPAGQVFVKAFELWKYGVLEEHQELFGGLVDQGNDSHPGGQVFYTSDLDDSGRVIVAEPPRKKSLADQQFEALFATKSDQEKARILKEMGVENA